MMKNNEEHENLYYDSNYNSNSDSNLNKDSKVEKNENIEKYKENISKIKVDEKLKNNTIKKSLDLQAKKAKNKKVIFRSALSIAACFVLVFGIVFATNKGKNQNINLDSNLVESKTIAKSDLTEAGFKQIENMDELKEIINTATSNYTSKSIIVDSDVAMEEESIDDTATSGVTDSSENYSSDDFSETNTQVENVDEADVVKTDGKYIYYIINKSDYDESTYEYVDSESNVIIIDVDTRNIVSTIKLNKNNSQSFYASEMYLYNNKLIIMISDYCDISSISNVSSNSTQSNTTITKAVIYDISDVENPTEERTITSTGAYSDSRMVNGNLYFISIYNNYYYFDDYNDEDTVNDNEYNITMPIYGDTLKNEECYSIDCTDIYYLENPEDSSFTMITAANIDENVEANTQTFLGIGGTIYSSENNMYIAKSKYNSSYSRIFGTYSYNTTTEIYKFKLSDNNIEFLVKTEVDGTVNDQFSMDEYNGYFRVATTGYTNASETYNNIFIFDEKLNEVGMLEGFEKKEEIYAVRFIGNICYVVTFVEMDPLLVIDLSNPSNPQIKGKLEIPGYSSYLQPYDETHIIGIGKNTEETSYGAVTSTTLKISMFDISDLENPKEIFNTTVGTESDYSNSEALYNHKAVLCNSEKEILALPINTISYSGGKTFSGAIIYKVDLESNKFEEMTTVTGYEKDSSYYYEDYKEYNLNVIDRIIYIGNYLYVFSNAEIKIVDMNTFEEIDVIEIK